MTNVNPVGRITYKCAGLYSDDNEKALKRVVDFARQYGNSKLGLQVGHAGRKGSTKVPALGGTPSARTKAPGKPWRRRPSPSIEAGTCRAP